MARSSKCISLQDRKTAGGEKKSSSEEAQRIAELQLGVESREMRFTFRIHRRQKNVADKRTNERMLTRCRRNNNNRVITRRPKALWRRSIRRGVREGGEERRSGEERATGKQRSLSFSFLFTIQSNPLITRGTRPRPSARHSRPRLREISERTCGGREARPGNGLRRFRSIRQRRR